MDFWPTFHTCMFTMSIQLVTLMIGHLFLGEGSGHFISARYKKVSYSLTFTQRLKSLLCVIPEKFPWCFMFIWLFICLNYIGTPSPGGGTKNSKLNVRFFWNRLQVFIHVLETSSPWIGLEMFFSFWVNGKSCTCWIMICDCTWHFLIM